jgi:uncharacterized membrane protein
MPHTYKSFEEMPEIETSEPRREPSQWVNTSHGERNWSIIGGAAIFAASLAGKGLTRIVGALIGGSLIFRGISGHCHTYEMLGIDRSADGSRAGVPDQAGHKVIRSIIIQRPREELMRTGATWRILQTSCLT